ncbi:MAG: hypothetical protein ACRD36_13545, partial [Candidatus Acidiferrum sp.]
VMLPLSVQGDSTTLHLFITSVPREAIPPDPVNNLPAIVSDLRRVSWWLSNNGDKTGLARQEVNIATSQDATSNLPPGIDNEETFIVAPEVKNIQFQYFDGENWNDTWDCTTPGTDGVTPIGPPLAIAVVLEIARPSSSRRNDSDPPTKSYRQVIGLLTANGATQQQQQQSTTSTSTGTGSTNP